MTPRDSEAAPRSVTRYRILLLGTFLVLCGEWIAVLELIRGHGATIAGDEAHYLVGAVSIGRFRTLNMNPGYNFAVEHHIIFPWTARAGPHLAAKIGQTHLSHGLYFLTHAIGLSVLLAIPMLAGTHVAEFALIAVLGALAVGLMHLVGRLSGIRSPWRIAVAGLFLTPAVALAATQVYPDLISGLVIANIILIIAGVEVRGTCSGAQLLAATLLFVALPWLDQKNVLLALPLLAAFVIVSLRVELSRRQLGCVVIATAISLAGLLALNLYSFSSLLGNPQPISLASLDTLARSIALLFDRRQGLFVQMPVAVLGVAGLWAVRRRFPVAAVTSVGVILLTIYGNATQEISFGGGSLIGRFQWPTLPLLLAFAGLYLLELTLRRGRVVAIPALVIGALFVVQFIPILRDEHILYNKIGWDPITYTGWWGGLDPSPVLGYIGGVTLGDIVPPTTRVTGIAGSIGRTVPWGNARVLWGLSCQVLVCATGAYLLVRLLVRPLRVRLPVVGVALGAILVTLAMTLSSTVLLPAPVTFPAARFAISNGRPDGTSVVVSGVHEHGYVVDGPSWHLLPGRYSATITYRLADGERSAALERVLLVTHPPTAGILVLNDTNLPPGRHSLRSPFTIRKAGRLVIRIAWNGPGTLTVESILLKKLTSG
ncbi:MAG: hypothetical protein ABSC41_16100 [Acidimicrobiales bacterium]